MNDGRNYIGNIRWHFGKLTNTPLVVGNTISNVVGSSKLYISSFLPSGATPTIKICDVNANSVMHPYDSGGPWPCTGGGTKITSRAEVSAPTPSANLNVLTVLYAT